jgi:hypothetical protein
MSYIFYVKILPLIVLQIITVGFYSSFFALANASIIYFIEWPSIMTVLNPKAENLFSNISISNPHIVSFD